MSEIRILTRADAISVVKPNRTAVDYYIFEESEIHRCTIPPHSVQEWHSHCVVDETCLLYTSRCV